MEQAAVEQNDRPESSGTSSTTDPSAINDAADIELDDPFLTMEFYNSSHYISHSINETSF